MGRKYWVPWGNPSWPLLADRVTHPTIPALPCRRDIQGRKWERAVSVGPGSACPDGGPHLKHTATPTLEQMCAPLVPGSPSLTPEHTFKWHQDTEYPRHWLVAGHYKISQGLPRYTVPGQRQELQRNKTHQQNKWQVLFPMAKGALHLSDCLWIKRNNHTSLKNDNNSKNPPQK